ncbi:MAG: rimI, partial [Nitrospira sp.]|nr:rimI [Nitrospira sp.]
DALDEVLAIEQACFSAPWTRKMLAAELSGNPFAHFLLAKCPDLRSGSLVIAGYFCFWILFEEVRLMNLAVLAPFRRQGIATRLICTALRTGLERKANRAMLEVRASNQEALTLYRGLGFYETARRTRYYTHPDEDAVTRRCDMQAETAITDRLRQSNTEFRALEESHHRLDAELADLQRRHVLTPAEEVLKKQLQKEKLATKDRMAELIRTSR